MILELINANAEQTTNSTGSAFAPHPNKTNFFVDLAAYESRFLSNTYLLEQKGWEGLCIEPNSDNWYDLAIYRKCTIVAAFVGGTEQDDGKVMDVKFSGIPGHQGIVGHNFDNKGGADAKRNVVSISTVFRETTVPSIIDYFSLDVEGAETFIMEKFPWDKYKMRFITIERPKDDLVSLLKEHGYEKLATISDFGETIWFHKSLLSISIDKAHAIVNRFL